MPQCIPFRSLIEGRVRWEDAAGKPGVDGGMASNRQALGSAVTDRRQFVQGRWKGRVTWITALSGPASCYVHSISCRMCARFGEAVSRPSISQVERYRSIGAS